MIKKLVSNALLSVVMDKQARDKFNAVQEEKRQRQGDGDAKRQPSPEPGAKAKVNSNKSKPATKQDRQTTSPAPALPIPPTASINDADAEALIREALDIIELELIQKRKKKPMTAGRRVLIEQAMAIHQEKSHILDDLDQETREKLTFMAMKALDRVFGE